MANRAFQSGIYTYSDYSRWSDDRRWELIDGHAYLMAPAPSTHHQSITLNLATLFRNCFREKPCRPFVSPVDVKLSEIDVVQPDVLIVCDPAKITEPAIIGARNSRFTRASTSPNIGLFRPTGLSRSSGLRQG